MEMQESYITDAVFDAKTGAWFKVSGARGTVWFSGSDFLTSQTMVLKRIGNDTGLYLADMASKRKLQQEVKETVPRDGTVASKTGWHGKTFVCGDGSVMSAESSVDVLAFDPLPKFTAEGELADWHAALAPFVARQSLPLFIIALSLSGPLLRFLSSSALNPIVELVGGKLSGKSTLGTLAASVWAGDPLKTEGGGESWNMTVNAFDDRRDDHRDMFLLLDEAEGGGSDQQTRQKLAASVIFNGAATSKKARATDVNPSPDPLRLALLSTANTSFREVLGSSLSKKNEAAASRVLSIFVHKESEDGLALFDTLPNGYEAAPKPAAAAASDLRDAVDTAYGTAGPAFARALADKVGADEQAFRDEVRARLKLATNRLLRIDASVDIRQCTTLAVVELAGYLAREAGVLPVEWGEPSQITDRVFRQITSVQIAESALAPADSRRLDEYVQRQLKMKKFQPSDAVIIPMPSVCSMTPGFVFVGERGGRELLVEPDYFERTFDGAKKFLKDAKKDGRLKTSPSEADRLQIHAPNWMLKYGFKRIYNIVLT